MIESNTQSSLRAEQLNDNSLLNTSISTEDGIRSSTEIDDVNTPLLLNTQLIAPIQQESPAPERERVKCLRTKKARIITATVISSVFLSLFIALVTLYFKWQRTDVTFNKAEAKYKNSIYGRIRIRNIDVNDKAATVNIAFYVGEDLKQKARRDPIIFSFNGMAPVVSDANGDLFNSFKVSKNNFRFNTGSSRLYPFDTYKYRLVANATTKGNVKIPVNYFLDSSILLFRARLQKQKNGDFDLIIQRSATTIIISLLAMLLLWGFTVSYTLLVVRIVAYKRKFVLIDFTLGLTLLFNVPALRSMMPSVPKMGVLVDIISVLWCLALMSIAALAVIMTGWIRDMYIVHNNSNQGVLPPDDGPELLPPEILSIESSLDESNMIDHLRNQHEFTGIDTTIDDSVLGLKEFEQEFGLKDNKIMEEESETSRLLVEKINNARLSNTDTNLNIVYSETVLGTKLENVLDESQIQRELEREINFRPILTHSVLENK